MVRWNPGVLFVMALAFVDCFTEWIVVGDGALGQCGRCWLWLDDVNDGFFVARLVLSELR